MADRRRYLLLAGLVVGAALLFPATSAVAQEHAAIVTRVDADADPELPGDHSVPVVSRNSNIPLTLIAELPDGSVTEPEVDVTYTWMQLDPLTSAESAISAAADDVYTPGSSDYPYHLFVRATITKPGFSPLTLDSPAVDYSVRMTNSPTVATESGGPARVGLRLEVEVEYERDGSPVTMTAPLHQWLRNGVAIPGAIDATYTPVLADLGKRISVRMFGEVAEYLFPDATTAETSAVAVGTLEADVPSVTTVGPSAPGKFFQLEANVVGVTQPDVTVKYKWYRDSVAVAPVSSSSPHRYQLTKADYGHRISVKVTMTKPGYAPLIQSSEPRDYSIVRTTPAPVIVGNPIPGGELRLEPSIEFEREVGAAPDSAEITRVYTWYRNGGAIADAHDDTYTLTTRDLGKKISVGVVATETGFLGTSFRSGSTQVIREKLFAGYQAPATVTQVGAALTASANIATTGVTYSYRWYRGSTAIPGATKSTYKLAAADWGKTIKVRVVASKTDYTTVVKYSTPVDYSLRQDAIPTLSAPGWRVGEIVAIDGQSYVTKDGPLASPAQTFQWYRDGVAIKGAVQSTYVIASADYKKRLSVRITTKATGYVSLSYLTPRTTTITKGVTSSAPTATVTTVGGRLSASITPGTLVPSTPTPAITYQWLRAGVKIPGATAKTYLPTIADAGKPLAVRLIITRANFTVRTLTAESAPWGYTVTPVGTPAHIVHAALSVDANASVAVATTYTDGAGVPVTPSFAYQWFRDGVPIIGETGLQHRLAAADVGAMLTARVTASVSGLAPSILTTQAVGPVVEAQFPPTARAEVTMTGTIAHTLHASILGLGFNENQTTRTYQWVSRDATVTDSPWETIVGANSSDYQLTNAMHNRFVSVRVTVAKLGWVTYAPALAQIPPGHNWSLIAISEPSLSIAEPVVGYSVIAISPRLWSALNNQEAFLGSVGDGCTWQWYRDGVLIANATGQTYWPGDADRGMILSVQVDCPQRYRHLQLPYSITAAHPVRLRLEGSFEAPTITKADGATTLTAELPAGMVTTPGATISYQWACDGPIAGATEASYTPVAADWGCDLGVRATASKAGYDPWTSARSNQINVSVTGSLPGFNDWSPTVGQTLTMMTAFYRYGGWEGVDFTPAEGTQTFSWYLDGVPVDGASEKNFVVPAEAEGKMIQVRVITNLEGWLSSNFFSEETHRVAPLP